MAYIGTRLLTLAIDSDFVTAEVSSCIIGSAATSSDFVSFADAAAGGGRDYSLKLKFLQDASSGSLWDQIFSHAGEIVTASIRPYGNAIPSAAQPHFTGNVVITEPDGDMLGGDADASTTARFVCEVEWLFTGKPSRITAAP